LKRTDLRKKFYRRDPEGNVILRDNQLKAIHVLLTGAPRMEAARAAGVTPRQISRWIEDPFFCAELKRQQDAVVRANVAGLVGAAELARENLINLIRDKNVRDSVKVRADQALLREAHRSVEQVNLIDRIAELEEKLGDEI
ncbi:MAG: hypothetical protein AMJ88_16815, partial [Anaerolineae bacterium SM23_ 63]